MSCFSIEKLVGDILSSQSSSSPPFWERFAEDGKIIYTNSSGISTYKVKIPNSDRYIVVKPKDTQLGNNNNARKTKIFQKLSAYYGVPVVQEVTINKNGKAFRIAEYIHAVDLASNIKMSRIYLNKHKKELVNKWFPEEFFDDYVPSLVFPSAENIKFISKVNLNTDKFRSWYKKAGKKEKKKAKKSITAIYHMLNDGFLLDFHGRLNLAYTGFGFTMVDVEPLQLSNSMYLCADAIINSQALLERLFSIFGLPSINYDGVVKKNYGKHKTLELRSIPCKNENNEGELKVYTNVTCEEELRLYEQRYNDYKSKTV